MASTGRAERFWTNDKQTSYLIGRFARTIAAIVLEDPVLPTDEAEPVLSTATKCPGI